MSGQGQSSSLVGASMPATVYVSQPREACERREKLWAWASLLMLIICWDAALRLDQHVSPPRIRIAHAGEKSDTAGTSITGHAGKFE